jgi:hypothetical protein
MFVSLGHKSPLSAKFSENEKQNQGDDAERDEPYKHHNNLSYGQFRARFAANNAQGRPKPWRGNSDCVSAIC